MCRGPGCGLSDVSRGRSRLAPAQESRCNMHGPHSHGGRWNQTHKGKKKIALDKLWAPSAMRNSSKSQPLGSGQREGTSTETAEMLSRARGLERREETPGSSSIVFLFHSRSDQPQGQTGPRHEGRAKQGLGVLCGGVLFCFVRLHPGYGQVPRPGIEAVPQQQPEPLR